MLRRAAGRLSVYVATGVLISLALAGCSDADTTPDTEAPTTSVATTTAPTTTTTAAATTTEPTGPPYEVALTPDVLYQIGKAPSLELVLDVWAPVADGPWPVVVTYHGYPTTGSKTEMNRLAMELAEQGAVVFNVNHGSEVREGYEVVAVENGSCSYWYAVEHASDHGGDPDDITLVGMDEGALAAATIAMGPYNHAQACAAEKTDVDPTALVLLEGDWLMLKFWDDLLAADPELFDRVAVWGMIEGYEGGPIHLIADRATIGSPLWTYRADGIADAMALRDSDGDLTARCEELGLMDPSLDLVDASILFHDQLVAAGVDATLTYTDSQAHRLTDESRAAIVELVLGGDA